MVTAVRRLARTEDGNFTGNRRRRDGLGPLLGVLRHPRRQKPAGTVITTRQGSFGTMLIVGSGKFAGYTALPFHRRRPAGYGCTATIVKSLPGGPGSCTGPSADKTAEWPAVTTAGAPVAGTGVSAKLLGSVARPGIGRPGHLRRAPPLPLRPGPRPGHRRRLGRADPAPLAWPVVAREPVRHAPGLARDAHDHRHRRQDRSRRRHVHRYRLGGLPAVLLHRRTPPPPATAPGPAPSVGRLC